MVDKIPDNDGKGRACIPGDLTKAQDVFEFRKIH